MREANARFAAAVSRGDVEAALAADDALHDVLVEVCANRAVAATIERYTPLIRRLERRKFATLSGQRSVRLHEELIEACAAGDADGAVRVSAAIWSALLDVLAQEPDVPSEAEELPRRRPRSRRSDRPVRPLFRRGQLGEPGEFAAETPGAADQGAAAPVDDPARAVDPARAADSPSPAGGC